MTSNSNILLRLADSQSSGIALRLFVGEIQPLLEAILTSVRRIEENIDPDRLEEGITQLNGFVESTNNLILSAFDYFRSHQSVNLKDETVTIVGKGLDNYYLPEEIMTTFAHELREPISLLKSYIRLYELKGISAEVFREASLGIKNSIAYLIDLCTCVQNYQRLWFRVELWQENSLKLIKPGSLSNLLLARNLSQFLNVSVLSINLVRDGLRVIYDLVSQNLERKAGEELITLGNFNYIQNLQDLLNQFRDVIQETIIYDEQAEDYLSPVGISNHLTNGLVSQLILIQSWKSRLLESRSSDLWHEGATDFRFIADKLHEIWSAANRDLAKWLDATENQINDQIS